MRYTMLGLLSIFLCLCTLEIRAQYPILNQFTTEDGLPGSKIYFSMQDSKGYIWSATERGVIRFDGHRFKQFTIKDGLPSNDVWHIQEDDKGRLWMDTFRDVCYYEDGKIKIWEGGNKKEEKGKIEHIFTPIGHFINNGKVQRSTLIDDRDSLLFSIVVNDRSDLRISFLLRENEFTEDLFKAFKSRLNLLAKDKLYLFNETILVDRDNRISEWVKNVGSQVEYLSSTSPYSCLAIISGKLWRLNQDTIQVVNLSKGDKEIDKERIRRVYKFAKNRIWIKTATKNYVVDTLFQAVENFDFLNNYSINHILEDQQKNLWISTNNGLFFLNKKAFTSKTYQIDANKNSESIKYLAIDQDHQLWGLSTEDYLYKLQNDKLIKVFQNPVNQNSTDLSFDAKGNLWVGGNYLIKILKPDLLHHTHSHDNSHLIKEVARFAAIKNIHLNSDNEMLFSNFQRLYKFKEKEYKSIRNGRFYGIASLTNGNCWISGKSGLQLINSVGEDLGIPGKAHYPLFDLPINNIVIGSDQSLWLSVNNRGVYRFDGEQLDSIPELANILVESMYVDHQEQLWVSTNQGLAKIEFIQSDTFDYSFNWYTELNGLASNDIEEIIVDENKIYASTEKALTVLIDEGDDEESNAPLYFSNLKINGKDTTIQDSYQLKHTQNNILIEYQCLDYQNMGAIYFQYKLDGVDNEWVDTKSFQKEYTLLPPKSYIFRLRRKPNTPKQSTPELLMRFTIDPPWWKKTWVLLSVMLLIGTLIYLLVQKRIDQVKKQAEEKNQLNQKFAELELRALQAQMNPHFVFNALHAIQDFILEKDERTTNRYLVKFSRLMRLFLESSKEKFISLEDELQLLTLYIELEQLRFEDKFEVEIDITEDLSNSLIEIPSMLIQPFVENAINHGLIHRQNPGKLQLAFALKNGQLHCRIEDNGIGRKKALAIKEQSIKSYKSRGMQLVEERQKMLNVIGETPVEITIKDLDTENGSACGTRVDLLINIS